MSLVKTEDIYQSKRIVCLEKGARQREDADSCWLGEQLWVSYRALEKFCLTNLDPIDIDLLLLAGLVCYADRSIRRRRNWVRNIELEVPVHDPDFWRMNEVVLSLSESLRFVTGDLWSFTFSARKYRDEQALRLHFDSSLSAEGVVLPYSGGLDSFAEFRLFSTRYPGKIPLLVTTVHNGHVSRLAKSTTEKQDYGRLRVPIKFKSGPHAEPSFRTRTFLFLVVASLAAKLSGCKAVLIPENGQGSIGPALIPSGGEHPFQSSHPGFTFRLARLLRSLWGRQAPSLNHPNKWLTKAQLLQEASGSLDGWQATKSCSCNTKRYKGSLAPEHCGLCSGCLLRRLALYSADVTGAASEKYLWGDLKAPSIEKSLSEELRLLIRPLSSNDKTISAAAIVDHKSLAGIERSFAENTLLIRSIRELSECVGESELDVQSNLHGLLSRHRLEWMRFVESLGDKSWVAKLAEAN